MSLQHARLRCPHAPCCSSALLTRPARTQIDCFPLPIPCFYTVYAEGRNKPFAITETSAAFYLSPINPPDQQATNLDMKRAWYDCPAPPCKILTLTTGVGPSGTLT